MTGTRHAARSGRRRLPAAARAVIVLAVVVAAGTTGAAGGALLVPSGGVAPADGGAATRGERTGAAPASASPQSPPAPWPEPVTPSSSPQPSAAPGGWGVAGQPAEDARPVRVRVPGAGVDATVIPVGVAADGRLEVPGTTEDVGWLATASVPGRVGPAVLAGHVDSVAGPAVFAHLAELAPGAVVTVDLDDGTVVSFTVTTVARYPKDEFPTDAVYGPAPAPELRLITCGGEFDRRVRSYRDNIVVTAVPVA